MLVLSLLALQVLQPTEDPALRVGGRMMLDAHFVGDGSYEDVVEARRMRLRLSGDLGEQLSFLTEYDFAGSNDLKELSLRWTDDDQRWRAGYFRQPFGLDNSMSSNFYSQFEESPMSGALGTSRAAGLAWRTAELFHMIQVGVYRAQSSSTGQSPDGSWSLNTRWVWRPWMDRNDDGGATDLLHLGVAANVSIPDGPLTFDVGPGLHGFPDFLTTAPLTADRVSRLALETAWTHGPWYAQAEYMGARIDLEISGADALDLHGWSVEAGWFPTGESRGYHWKRSTFDRNTPRDASGAWQLSARLGAVDLTEAPGVSNTLDSASLVAIHHFTPHARLLVGWTHAEVETMGSTEFFSVRFGIDW